MKFCGLLGRHVSAALFALTVVGCADVAPDESEDSLEAIDGTSQALTATSFSMPDAYYGDSLFGGCSSGSKKDIVGSEPAEPGAYPVFVYLTGTTMSFTGAEAQLLTAEMAKRGFVAATVEYSNSTYPSCSTMKKRAECIFNASSANSAISKICSRAKADCRQGIVVSGFSQGANLAALSKNYDARVKGAYLLGHGNKASIINVASCANDSATALLPTEMRSVNGEKDQYFGGSQSGVRTQLQAVTGVRCSGTNCLQAGGNGWYIVTNSQVSDGSADHCYFFKGANSSCSSNSGFETAWATGTQPWSLQPNLSWLAARVGL
jgi:dienelactone hydrolase